ncbi:MFS transporter [uncultured Sphingomonas sp.]|uniref:MFS transporter n=1 Tax=uncultured Sphingomonas sp. TaxID=158754 RepID=UPI0035C98267
MRDGSIRPVLTRRQVAAVVAGNGLEFYDFVTYSFFAAQIGRALFPQGGGYGLLLSLATFGVGFVTRPLGGLIIGRIADRRGRKPAMLLSFGGMGFALVGLALTPGYATIGMAAPVLAVLFRMIQGFALGGEVGPNTAFLLESAPPGKRGLFVSFQYATQDGAVLLSGLVGVALSSMLTGPQLDAWGWRIAFLLGALIVPFTLAVRRSLAETLPDHAPEAGGTTGYARVIVAGLMLIAATTIANYTLDYLTTYAQTTLKMEVNTAFGATVMIGLGGVVADLATGRLCDRFGRKRVLLVPWVALILLGMPAFLLMDHFRSATALLSMSAVLSLLLSAAAVPALVLFTEALPVRVRAGSIGLVYATAVGLFGGSAQLVEHQLIDWTGIAIAPAWYMTAALVIGLVGVALIREISPPPRDVRAGADFIALEPL